MGLGMTAYTYVQCQGLSGGCPPLIHAPVSLLVGGLSGAALGWVRPGQKWTEAASAGEDAVP